MTWQDLLYLSPETWRGVVGAVLMVSGISATASLVFAASEGKGRCAFLLPITLFATIYGMALLGSAMESGA